MLYKFYLGVRFLGVGGREKGERGREGVRLGIDLVMVWFFYGWLLDFELFFKRL